jgi:Leucine-rich repeat (LRR) protein
MVKLTIFDLHNNELKLLPPSLCECKELTELIIFGNRLLRLPTLLGTLPKLSKIDAAANCLTQIPFSLGYSNSLVDLNVSENPLTDPPLEEVVKGNESLKWYLRNRLLIEQRGMPPVMEFHDMGIMHEITILQPEIKEKIRYILEASKETGLVNLQLMGLTDIPRQLFKCTHIKKLQLDYNNHLELHSGFAPELQSLKYLSIKSCRIPTLPENVKNLKRLIHLNLEENLLESLPPTMSTLRSLQFLGTQCSISWPSSSFMPSIVRGLCRFIKKHAALFATWSRKTGRLKDFQFRGQSNRILT